MRAGALADTARRRPRRPTARRRRPRPPRRAGGGGRRGVRDGGRRLEPEPDGRARRRGRRRPWSQARAVRDRGRGEPCTWSCPSAPAGSSAPAELARMKPSALFVNTSRGPASSTRTPCSPRCGGPDRGRRPRRVRPSSRCRPTTRCARCRTWSSPRTSATSPREGYEVFYRRRGRGHPRLGRRPAGAAARLRRRRSPSG